MQNSIKTINNPDSSADCARKDYLIDWIHRVEVAKEPEGKDASEEKKRLYGLVTEAYFERALRLGMWQGVSGEFATGWSYRTDWSGCSRSWLKLSDGRSQLLNQAFVARILEVRPADRFFTVRATLSVPSSGGLPAIGWEAQGVDGAGSAKTRLDQKEALKLGKSIGRNVKDALEARRSLEHAGEIAHWLRLLDEKTLERLLVTRCLMNFGDLYLTDIDAVARAPSGQLEFVEFKRKSPARGQDAWKLVPAPADESAARVFLEHTAQLDKRFNPPDLRRLGRDERHRALNDALERLGQHLQASSRWQQADEYPGFGLDESHVRNVQLAARADMTYRYIIWNSDENDPDKLFGEDMVPRDTEKFVYMLVRPRHFDRITKTSGRKSGTYTRKIRFQLLIPVGDNFRPLAVRCGVGNAGQSAAGILEGPGLAG